MSDLVIYDRMCTAIAECHRVDEVLDIKDKARALEVYAQQAHNTDAERKACEIRLRAERKSGELLKELAKATPSEAGAVGGYSKAGVSNDVTRQTSEYAAALERTGMSRQTANRYEALANIPEAEFEEALRDPVVKPSTTRLIQAARDPQPQIDDTALWLWGRLRDFERDAVTNRDPSDLLGKMTETMQADVLRIAPVVSRFLAAFEVAHEPA